MTTLIAIAAILIFTISEALADSYQFRDLRKIKQYATTSALVVAVNNAINDKTRWHFWQAVRQGTFIVFASIFAGHWAIALFTASLFWLIHDGIVNTVGLDRKFFFVGTTAWFDKTFRRFFTGNPEAAMAVAKFGMLAASAAAYFIF